jgi:diguanylate cyclase (GGDEF)-like protein
MDSTSNATTSTESMAAHPGTIPNNRILVVDDDLSVLSTYQAALSPDSAVENGLVISLYKEAGIPYSHPEADEEFLLDYASSGSEAIELVARSLQSGTPYAVIFMDVRMPPGMDGLEAAVKIRQIDPSPYIVFVTAFSDYSAEQMHQKLDNKMMLISKPFGDDALRQSARMLCDNWGREQYLHKAYEQLQDFSNLMAHQATHDGLTGLHNRHYLNETLEKEVKRAQREQQPIGILMIDVDRFKWYNDYYGHLHGDQTLHNIAHQLNSVVQRPSDLVARFGGEEFCMVLPNTEYGGIEKIAAEICNSVEAMEIDFPESDIAPTVTVSVGGICCIPQNQNSRALLATADQQLYQAKEKGRNRFELTHCQH